MKLSKLHIINFGKLNDFTYDFNDGLNSFLFENGWGKTTLSNFILVMLYGFNGNGRTVSTNLRKKYLPWNGGTFGGSLEFNHNGKTYLIERTFGSQSNSDTFTLYDLSTNKVSNDYTSNIGYEILGLDYNSFERSIYIPQKDLDLGFNEDLKSKLANVIGGTNDVQNFESAINIISSKYKEIKKSSKAGKIFDKKQDLESLEKEIEITKMNISTISKLQSDVNTLEEEIKKLEEERTKVFNDLKELNEYESYQQSLKQLEHLKQELNDLKVELIAKENVLNGNNLNSLELYKEKINTYEKLLIERDVLRKNSTNNQVEEVISTNDLSELENEISNLDTIKNNASRTGLFIGISIGLMVIGLIVLFLVDKLLGGIITGLSLVCLLIFIFIFNGLKNKKKDLIQKITVILKKNDLDVIDINNGLNYLKVKKNEQVKSLEKKVKQNDEINKIELEISELQYELNNYFSKFILVSQDYKTKVNEIEAAMADIFRLKNTIKTKEEYINQYILDNKLDKELEENTNDFNSLKDKSNSLNEKISAIQQELNRLMVTISTYEEDKAKIEDLLVEKDRLTNEIKNMERSYEILKTTESLLIKSQESLLAKYVKPMKDRLNEYLSMVSNKNFYIDTEFNFTYEENGIRREIDYYSKGIQQLIVLCMRFSLVDCLFSEDKPFIILDDSFVDFDEANLSIIKEVLNKLKEEYQIIYFTCHESRVMD